MTGKGHVGGRLCESPQGRQRSERKETGQYGWSVVSYEAGEGAGVGRQAWATHGENSKLLPAPQLRTCLILTECLTEVRESNPRGISWPGILSILF